MSAYVAESWLQLFWLLNLTGMSCWFSFEIVRPTFFAFYPPKDSQAEIPGDQAKRLMLHTSLTSLSFTISLILYVVTNLMFMNEVGWFKTPTWKQERKAFFKIRDVYDVSALFQYIAYFYILVLSFERLKSVFQTSVYAISDWTIRSFYIMHGICVTVVGVVFLIAFVFGRQYLRFEYLIIATIFFTGASIWISWKFFTCIRLLASTSGSAKSSQRMFNVALKFTILNMTALLSTTIVGLTFFFLLPIMTVLFGVSGFTAVWRIYEWFLTLDLSTNTLVLMLTIKDYNDRYHWCFGRLHRYWLSRLTGTEEVEKAVARQLSQNEEEATTSYTK